MGLFSRNNGAYDDNYNNNYDSGNRYGNTPIDSTRNTHHGIGQSNNNMPMTQTSNIANDGTTHHGIGHNNQNGNIMNDGTTHRGLGHNNQTVGQNNYRGNDGINSNTFGRNDGVNAQDGLGHNNQNGNVVTDGSNTHNGLGHHNQNRFGNDGTTSHTIGRSGGYNDEYPNGKTHDRRRAGGGGFLGGLMGRRNRTGTQRGRHTNRGEKRMSHRQKNREKRAVFDIDSGYYNRRPSFGQWIKFTWLDLVTMACMGIIGIGVYNAQPAPSRSFPVTFTDGQIVDPQFAYPLRHNIIPIWAAALLASLVPIFVILCMQIRIRSFWDVNNAIIGLLYSLIGAALFQVFVKWLIGGLRPHFLAVCDPDPSIVGTGYRAIMFDRKVCRGNQNEINDSLESMPSGHSTAAWAGFLYLYFYLNAKMKVFSNHHPSMWKMIALYAPVLGATLITGSLTIDEYHNWYDCLAGAVIGSVFAISAYRMVYASVWDFRFNHIPLTRHTPFSYGAGAAGAGGFESAVFTRKAGWGFEEAYGGAPFDAAHGLRGQTMGFNQGAPGRHGGAGIMGNKLDNDVERNAGATTTGHDNKRHGHGHHHNDGYDSTTGTHDNNMHNGNATGGGLTGHRHQHGYNNNNNTSPINNRDDNLINNRNDGLSNTRNDGLTNNRNDGLTNTRNDGLTNNRNDGLMGTRNDGLTNNRNDNLPNTRDNNFSNTRNDGVTTNRDFNNEPTTPTRTSDGRYHHHSRSLERKQIPTVPGEGGTGNVRDSQQY